MSTTNESTGPSNANNVAGVGMVENADAGRSLKGNMGVIELIFTVLAYNGPVVLFLGFIPVAILLGNGVGTPVAFIVCGAVIALVAYGIIVMSARLDRPGGFYALITAGLGRVAGLSAGFTALTCYFIVLLAVYALGGIALNTVVRTLFHGPDITWWVWALVMLVAAAVLGYFNISFSAKVLTAFLACELLLMVVYNVAVWVRGGAHGIGLDSFAPSQITSGSVAIALVFGIGLFGGFEATVIFRDELKNPQRTIPVATYAVVALMTILYGVTTWSFINAYGAKVVVDILNTNLSDAAAASIKDYVGDVAFDAATIMLFTSSFALVLSAHNITARYLFNLGSDGILPRSLGSAHPKHVSPHRASIVLSLISFAVLAASAIANVSSADLYARFAGLYGYAYLILLTLVALAAGVYLIKDRACGRAIAPAACSWLGFIVMCITLMLASAHFEVLTFATGTTNIVLLVIIWGITAFGAALALVLRRRKPDVYARIGRQ